MKKSLLETKVWGKLIPVLFMVALIFPNVAAAGNPPGICSAAELQALIGSSALVVVDSRGLMAYRKGHINGAIHLDAGCGGPLVEDCDKFPCCLRPAPEIITLLQDKGISPAAKIVVYGDKESWGAEGRLLWILDGLGYRQLYFLNGGYDYWLMSGGATKSIFADHKKPCSKEAMSMLSGSGLERSRFSAAELNERYRQNGFIFLDVRDEVEYKGAILYGERRGGHLPQALHLHWKSFWNDDYRLKSKAELFKTLAAAGLPKPDALVDKSIIVYCTGGIRSGYVWWVLRWLGYPKVINYDNGFWEWAATAGLPIE